MQLASANLKQVHRGAICKQYTDSAKNNERILVHPGRLQAVYDLPNCTVHTGRYSCHTFALRTSVRLFIC